VAQFSNEIWYSFHLTNTNGSLHGWRDIRASDDEDGKPHETKEAGGEGR